MEEKKNQQHRSGSRTKGKVSPEKAAPETREELASETTPEVELEELRQKYLYLQAEYQNYRKRMGKELSEARMYATESALHPFLTVFDFLAMAENAAEKSDNIESIRQGLKMIIAEFNRAFEDIGLKPFDAAGQEFNPALHDAAAHEPSESVPEGTVLKQWNCGFKLGDRLLRPARVVVSSGVPTPPEAEPAAGEEAE